MEAKKISESRTIKTSLILPNMTNYHGTVFGGQVLSDVDEVAGIAAMKHCRRRVVTASIDSFDFLASAKLSDAITLEAFVVSTGTTSMEIIVKVSSENLLTGERTLTGVSFATFVALDEEGNPTQVPAVIPETEEEIRLVESASERQKQRKNRKQNVQSFIKQYHIDKTI
jgi:acyl-CoA hydrolase